METVTLEQIHEELLDLKQEVQSLKECVHEDFLHLSKTTEQDIEASRKQIAAGKFLKLEEL